ncbi:hypothetical protein FRC09_007766 [Ceratobasidium sp. 395]|nr:hypothetical protein FRC09_007766 [Ceratobasidium sp. 395]
MQAKAGQHPDAAMAGVLFGSDATHLSHYAGDVKVHALYVSLGNIHKDVRAQTSKRAWMLLAYIPNCKWEATLEKVDPNTKSERKALPGILSRRLFHLCMEIVTQPMWEFDLHEIVNPEGNVRLVFYVLIAYRADLEEQYVIAALNTIDLLHGFHKFFFDHPFQWNKNSLTDEKMDARIKAQVPYLGSRMFPRGVTHISQMSGKEHRAIQETHLSVVANSGKKYALELTNVTRALLDFLYYAQLPGHTEDTIKAFEAAYDEFHKQKDIWIKNGSRRGKTEVIPHFNIPKLHHAGHLGDHICAKGSANNFTTETIEHLHMDTIKEAYLATNKKDWEKQTLRWMTRREKLIEFLLFHRWRKGLEASANPAIATKGIGDGEVGNVRTDNDITAQAGGVTTECPEPAAQRYKRGGFAPVIANNPAPNPGPMPQAKPATAATKKRKRQIDDPDNNKERCAKRIESVQQTYGLSEFHHIAVSPSETLTMAEVQSKYALPTLLDDCKATHLVPASTSLQTVVGVWKSVRVQQPQSRFFPKPGWIRVHAEPPSDKDPAVADPVLFVKGRGNSKSVDRSQLKLQGAAETHNLQFAG